MFHGDDDDDDDDDDDLEDEDKDLNIDKINMIMRSGDQCSPISPYYTAYMRSSLCPQLRTLKCVISFNVQYCL